MSSEFIGVFRVPDPAGALRGMGDEPVWHDDAVAFAGSPVWLDRSGSIVVAGEVLLDDRERLRTLVGWKDAGDGELLAELYAREGVSAGRHAAGMVGAAVWDRRRQTLSVLRDHVGARTIYTAQHGDEWWFASRLRNLARTPAVSGGLSLQALRDYLVFSYVPGAQTLWHEAREVRPGTSMELGDHASATTHWEPLETAWEAESTVASHTAHLRRALEHSVCDGLSERSHVGAYLSGGVDSSLVTALAARETKVSTYAIHFGPDIPNELEYSSLVAQHCGTSHTLVDCGPAAIREYLPATMRALDEPIGDPLTVPNYLLGRAAARDVDVILNGEGGDPCFGGPKNVPMLLYELYGGAESRETAYLRSYRKCYDDLDELLTADVREDLTRLPTPEAAVAPYFGTGTMGHLVNRLMHANVRMKGTDHILTKVNNITSAHGLLGLSPLFRRDIVEQSFAIPPHHKVRGSTEKVVLKAAVADLLPAAIIERPKSGMMVPIERWMRGELRSFARDALLDPRARIAPFIRQDVLRRWLDFDERGPRTGARLWLVLSLECWLREQPTVGSPARRSLGRGRTQTFGATPG